jgi:hypothetical protein
MDIFEITGYRSGIAKEGVTYLEPADSFQEIVNGFVYRQVVQSRKGFTQFGIAPLADGTRVMGIFEHILPDNRAELLVISQEFLYRYNGGTNAFDVIPNAGAAPVGGFGMTANYPYVSGTTYNFADGSTRFVFTGAQMSDIYMYDGTDVKSFTTVGDNPDYVAPALGALTNAWYVLFFGGRLCVFNPTIAGNPNQQMVLYTAIRDTSGNGDNFNAAGAGDLSADTNEYIQGVSREGNFTVVNFSRSNWVLEITRDAFNPFFYRRIPSVIGTDAPFSAVSWDGETKSVGRTGIISTDGRSSKRIDNQVPFFTRDEIDQEDFGIVYGGFDRSEGQFLWSYLDSESQNTTQDRVLVNNYEEGTWAVFEQRFSCFGQTENGLFVAWNDIDEDINPLWEQWNTTTDTWNRIGLGEYRQKTLAGDNDGFVYDINIDYNDYAATISAITNASNAVVTTSDQAFKTGDRVGIFAVEGMTQINNFDPENPNATFTPYTVISDTSTTLTLNVNTTDFDVYTTGGVITKLISFSATTVPFNPYRESGRRIYMSHVELLVESNNGYVYLDIFMDEETSP